MHWKSKIAASAARSLPVLALTIALTTPMAAQETFRACYVPAIGAIYMIGRSGLPAACLSTEHQEISWTEGGTIADGSIGTAQLADGGVGTADLADGAVTAAKVTGGAIGSAQIADGAVTSAKLGSDVTIGVADGSIGSSQLADGGVGSADLADGAVTRTKIANNAIGSGQIDANAVGSEDVADNTLTSDDLGTNSVGTAELQDASVTSIKIANGTITSSDIATNAIGAAQIAAGAVGSSELASGAVTVESLIVVGDNLVIPNNSWYPTTYGTDGANVEMSCPVGYVVVYGGWQWSGGSVQIFAARSVPSPSEGLNSPRTWRFLFRNDSGSTGSVVPRIVCVRAVS